MNHPRALSPISGKDLGGVGEKELFFARQKGVGATDDWAQRGHHLQTNDDVQEGPDAELAFACLAACVGAFGEESKAEGKRDGPEYQVEKGH